LRQPIDNKSVIHVIDGAELLQSVGVILVIERKAVGRDDIEYLGPGDIVVKDGGVAGRTGVILFFRNRSEVSFDQRSDLLIAFSDIRR
jgi:hypothetical protein